MATRQLRTYKGTLVLMLNYVKPGNAWTVESQLTQADLTLRNVELMRWFNFKTWGNPDPAPDHAYLPQKLVQTLFSVGKSASASSCPKRIRLGITYPTAEIQQDATKCPP